MLVQSNKGLRKLIFEKDISNFSETNSEGNCYELIKDNAALSATKKQLEEYFNGKRINFNIQLDISISNFYKKVLIEVMKIPFGNVMSYKQIAVKINNPQAYRAVGTANAKNTIPIIIPCHRVIANNGTLGGYGGGLKIKKFLLKMEGVI
tara:strand:+ start:3667 stop:4116 length:450 start_codon:yes stop_codon:yes gene_type:complete